MARMKDFFPKATSSLTIGNFRTNIKNSLIIELYDWGVEEELSDQYLLCETSKIGYYAVFKVSDCYEIFKKEKEVIAEYIGCIDCLGKNELKFKKELVPLTRENSGIWHIKDFEEINLLLGLMANY